MSDSDTPPDTDQPSSDAPDADVGTPSMPEEWKPEPRKWEWKDLFVTPMLAFKPKVMLVSAATLILLNLFVWGWRHLTELCYDKNIYVINTAVLIIGIFVAALIFSLGASLVAIFMKADQLDDEFLSLKEALGQWVKRLKAVVMVPLFLVGTLAGFYVFIYLCLLLCSIPIAGSLIYVLLYPIGFLVALLFVLLAIAVALGFFVFPAIIAIRKHGWFDNVIDTFEAVGTKTHIVVLNLVLVLLFIGVARFVANGSVRVLNLLSGIDPNLPGEVAPEADSWSSLQADRALRNLLPRVMPAYTEGAALANARKAIEMVDAGAFAPPTSEGEDGDEDDEGSVFGEWVVGIIGAVWKFLIALLLGGYIFNLFVGGGMMTYLAVREDDYWDDEDLEDLDKLAKELEEEAKAEAEQAEAAMKAEEAPGTTDAPAARAGAKAEETEPEQADGADKAKEKKKESKKKESKKKESKKKDGKKKESKAKDEKKDEDG